MVKGHIQNTFKLRWLGHILTKCPNHLSWVHLMSSRRSCTLSSLWKTSGWTWLSYGNKKEKNSFSCLTLGSHSYGYDLYCTEHEINHLFRVGDQGRLSSWLRFIWLHRTTSFAVVRDAGLQIQNLAAASLCGVWLFSLCMGFLWLLPTIDQKTLMLH